MRNGSGGADNSVHASGIPDLKSLCIALALRCFDPKKGGLESWTFQLAKQLLEWGHQVHVVAGEFGDHGLPVMEHRFEPHPLPSIEAQRIAEALQPLSADITHDAGSGYSVDVFQPHTGSRVLNLARDLRSLSWRARLRATLSPASRRWREDLRQTERRQLVSSRFVVAVSQSVADALRHLYGVAPERIAVVPNGVDTRRFTPAACARHRVASRAEFGVIDEVAFLVVAQNFRLKGLDATLAAVARLAGRGKPVKLLVAGGGPIDRYRRSLAGTAAAERVAFLGHCDAMERVYAAADVFVHPTFHDACSLATLEALASGLPVITTIANGAADGMVNGREGFVLQRAGDVAALSEAMDALLDADRRAACAAAAANVGQARSFAANCDGILAVYEKVLRQRSGR